MDNEYTLRRALTSDAPVLADLRVRFLAELHPMADEAAAGRLRASLEAYFAETVADGRFVGWLAVRGDDIVATAGMVLWQIPARDPGAPRGTLGYILNCYTVPEARRQGLVTRLMRKLIDEGRSLGVGELQLHATNDGVNIYRGLGFAEPEYPVLEMKL